MHPLLQQSLLAGQQAAQCEAMGNAPAAAQCYDSAAQMLAAFISQAQMSGFPVADQVFNWLAQAQFGAARAKAALGFFPAVPVHLQQALAAVNQAVMRNPGAPANHALAGMILCAQGNLQEAARALGQACALNPADQMARAMLAQVTAHLGNQVPPMPVMPMPPMPNPGMPNPGMPNPAMPVVAPVQPAPNTQARDWTKTATGFVHLATEILKATQQAEQTFNFHF